MVKSEFFYCHVSPHCVNLQVEVFLEESCSVITSTDAIMLGC